MVMRGEAILGWYAGRDHQQRREREAIFRAERDHLAVFGGGSCGPGGIVTMDHCDFQVTRPRVGRAHRNCSVLFRIPLWELGFWAV
jgi:hypothetical protein